jgi:hypothetical protein
MRMLSEEPHERHERRSLVIVVRYAAACMLLMGVALTACSSSDEGDRTPSMPPDGFASDQRRVEDIVSRHLSADSMADAVIDSASFVTVDGVVKQPNAGGTCDSGRLFRIRLSGSFPHTVTSGGFPGSKTSEVRTVLLKADYDSGLVCQVGASTESLAPERGATAVALY